jgi:hypothetical protein
MMKSIDYYQQKIEAQAATYDRRMAEIIEDDWIEPHEVSDGQTFINQWTRELRALKKELTLDLRALRTRYQEQIVEARSELDKPRNEISRIHVEQNKALAPYQHAELMIDRLVVRGSGGKRLLGEGAVAEVRKVRLAEIIEPINYYPDEAESDPTAEERELSEHVAKWRQMFKEVDELWNSPGLSVWQRGHIAGARRALMIVLEDVDAL